MKKKVVLSVAATAALLMTNPVADKADAAFHIQTKGEAKTYVFSEKLSNDQINRWLQKYFSHLPTSWKNAEIKTTEAETNQPVEQPKQSADLNKPTAPVTNQESAQTEQTQKQQTPNNNQATYSLSAYEQQVVELTNQERAKQGLAPLKVDLSLSKVAREKSQDMKTNNYFSHTSPVYGSPFDMMKQFGISYRSAGENIAKGQQTPEAVVKAWMNSDGHRKNIMSTSFTHIGVGYVAEGNYWTQQFIGK
ncbi:CAP domain-containing protein [Cytobacillus spongiae]|uniref:CAP domain-containing protein n=1 Tax=Cytobacillus spongiae TaxID=2901381 RepID=UPI001F1DE200|nr:CAP domain-containing protein [Cytobacillus spongiae]UII54448.1 CAP domain-containing protein [Cytobacillus spongiae]